MSDPVTRRENSAIREFYGDNPTGPGADEVKDSQQPMREMKDVATDILWEAGEHALTHKLVESADRYAERIGSEAMKTAAHAALMVYSVAKGTFTALELSIVKPNERGQAIERGYASDQARLAGVLLTQAADPALLPKGYAESLKGAVVGSGSFFNSRAVIMATRLQADIAKGDPEAIAFRDHLLSSIQSGIDAAHLYHVDSQAALDQSCEQDPAFRNRYLGDPGFQIGIRAAIWQAQVFPDDFASAERDRGLQTANIQLARGA